MRLLLDTHIFLWWDRRPEKLPSRWLAALRDPTNTLLLSVASVWEMQIKSHAGKLELGLPLAELMESQRLANGIEVLPIQLAHVLALDELPPHHRDPFDRLVIAQANAEDLTLVRVDPVFANYPVRLLGTV
ncbi:type II toxin-antitoxin system VapC family toxin [soil metagenome]